VESCLTYALSRWIAVVARRLKWCSRLRRVEGIALGAALQVSAFTGALLAA